MCKIKHKCPKCSTIMQQINVKVDKYETIDLGSMPSKVTVVSSIDASRLGNPEIIELVPYGCTFCGYKKSFGK